MKLSGSRTSIEDQTDGEDMIGNIPTAPRFLPSTDSHDLLTEVTHSSALLEDGRCTPPRMSSAGGPMSLRIDTSQGTDRAQSMPAEKACHSPKSPPPVQSSPLYLSSPPPAPPQSKAMIIDDDFGSLPLNPINHILPLKSEQPMSMSAQSLPSPTKPKSDLAPKRILLFKVPIDAFHCISTFLTIGDCCNLSLASKESQVACRDIFYRIRMHAFKCAIEVVTAWERGEHSDAKQLAALYIHSGIPIYPVPLNDAFNTILCRMNIETQAMNPPVDGTGGTPSKVDTAGVRVRGLDRFYAERNDVRNNGGYGLGGLTYLEEKSLFWRNKDYMKVGGHLSSQWKEQLSIFRVHRQDLPHRQTLNTSSRQLPERFGQMMNNELGEHEMASLAPMFTGSRNLSSDHQELDLGMNDNMSVNRPKSSKEQSSKIPTTYIRCHQHLIDRHFLGCRTVDEHVLDDDSFMIPLSLSEDFFHPTKAPSKPSSKYALLPMRTYSSKRDACINQYTSPTLKLPRVIANQYGVDNMSEDTTLGTLSHRESDSSEEELTFASLPKLPTNQFGNGYQCSLLGKEMANINLQPYSFLLDGSKDQESKSSYPLSSNHKTMHIQERADHYEKLLSSHLKSWDHAAFDETLLDFWDEVLKLTEMIHFYDKRTPIPRMSCLNKFLNRPCPKALGTMQCEIMRVKLGTKRSVKGRLFPTYEYRLFIRDGSYHHDPDLSAIPGHPARQDTVLLVAKYKGKSHVEMNSSSSSSQSNKKGVNNYYIYSPTEDDIRNHFDQNNESMEETSESIRQHTPPQSMRELGRLQSNFTGTDFQIFSPCTQTSDSAENLQESSQLEKGMASLFNGGDDNDCVSLFSAQSTPTLRPPSRRGQRPSTFNFNSGGSISNDNRSSVRRPWSTMNKNRTSRRAIANSKQTRNDLFPEAEIGAITYTANLFGNRPRVMDVSIPKISPSTLDATYYTSTSSNALSMLNKLKILQYRRENPQTNQNDVGEVLSDIQDNFGLLSLQNRPPWWNAELGAFVLNFGGRVSVASVKNFQLCDRNDNEDIMLQFGRIKGRHLFTMDFSYPLSPVQAFAVAISSLQSKFSFG